MRHRLALATVLILTFLSFIFLPAYMVYLRHRLANALPSEWANVTNNGSFTYVSPLIVTTRNHEEGVYAAKVRQIALHGLPYDPHTGDRSFKSWFLESMTFLPMTPLLWLSGGDVQRAYILCHALLGMLWLLLFYRVFLWYSEDPPVSLAFACGTFFFIDVWMWALTSIIPQMMIPTRWDLSMFKQCLFLLVARAFGQIDWVRAPTSGLNFLWTAASLMLCFKLALSKRRPWLSLAAGAFVGALSPSHFYEWMSGVGGLLCFSAVCILARLPKDGLVNLAFANAVSLSLSAAYYLTADALTRGVFADITSRMGIPGRVFHWESLLCIALAAWFWTRASRMTGKQRWFWLLGAALELAAAGLLNLSLVLGFEKFAQFILLAASTALVWSVCLLLERQKLRDALRPHAYWLACLVLMWTFLREKSWAETHYKLFGTPRDVDAAAEWINKNSLPGSKLLLLSGALTEFLPLKLDDARFAASNGCPAYGSIISTRDVLMGLASILKTVDADAERFLERRWGRAKERDDLKQHLSHYSRNLAWRETDDAAWTYFLLNIQAYRVEREGLGMDAMTALYREAPRIPPPFYFWVHKGDAEFLKTRPEKLGGVLVYENPSVRLYHFKGDAS